MNSPTISDVERQARELLQAELDKEPEEVSFEENPDYEICSYDASVRAVVAALSAQPEEQVGATCDDAKAKFNAAAFGQRVLVKMGNRSFRDVASEIGIGHATLNRVARGKAPDIQTYLRITKWLDEPLATTTQQSVREAVRSELINTPETADFMAAVPLEAAHQRERWGVEHDAGKSPFDWFWLIGYLAQKAASSAVSGDVEKAKHHTISTAAALANWHAALTGSTTEMRPGIGPENGGEKPGSAYSLAAALGGSNG